MIKLCLVAGARPNFMKIAPLIRAILAHGKMGFRLVHTGQHYDRVMNDVFFEELGIPEPDVNLNCGGGSHAEQTAKVMLAFETELIRDRPDWVVVVGDVNSTLACAVTAKKMGVRVAHVEAGLRSGDRSMPEEINRLVTDSISDLLFVTEPSGELNLLKEGHSREVIHFVGHVMIDNLFHQLSQLSSSKFDDTVSGLLKGRLLSERGMYGVVTLHRPSNVDDEDTLSRICFALAQLSKTIPLIFPVHPRTEANLKRYAIQFPSDIHLLPPLAYMEFLNIWKDAKIVLSDSGGLQEETTALGVPCVTLRESTERPVTVSDGTNRIAGTKSETIIQLASESISTSPSLRRPRLWDGRAAQRVVDVIFEKSVSLGR